MLVWLVPNRRPKAGGGSSQAADCQLPVGGVKHSRGSLCEGLFGLQQARRLDGTVLCLHAK